MSMTNSWQRVVVAALMFLSCGAAAALEPIPGTLDVHWNEGVKNCKSANQPPIQVHVYNAQTFILRQNPCVSFEANFLYLLVGSNKALLIDSGAIADSHVMPLADTVLRLLPTHEGQRLPLLVVHTHKHLDHRSGDVQFEQTPGVQVVPADLNSVKAFFGFNTWPGGVAHLDLGDRLVDVIPTPGHQDCHVMFYDNKTALLLSGDFLMPGRLLIEDKIAFRDSAARLVKYFQTRPLTHVLGGHIELNAEGKAYSFGSHYHPNEHRLELSREDIFALPAALEHFDAYKRYPNFILFSANLEFVLALEKW